MAFECDDCGMDFDTSQQLANHKQKFCMHSRHDVDKIDARLDEL